MIERIPTWEETPPKGAARKASGFSLAPRFFRFVFWFVTLSVFNLMALVVLSPFYLMHAFLWLRDGQFLPAVKARQVPRHVRDRR